MPQNTTSHTPGPWYFSPSYDAHHRPNGEYVIQGSNEIGGGPVLPILSRTHNWPDNAEANARLIAAAPDLLEAAKGAKQILDCVATIGLSSMIGGPQEGSTADKLNRAIAKAEGR